MGNIFGSFLVVKIKQSSALFPKVALSELTPTHGILGRSLAFHLLVCFEGTFQRAILTSSTISRELTPLPIIQHYHLIASCKLFSFYHALAMCDFDDQSSCCHLLGPAHLLKTLADLLMTPITLSGKQSWSRKQFPTMQLSRGRTSSSL